MRREIQFTSDHFGRALIEIDRKIEQDLKKVSKRAMEEGVRIHFADMYFVPESDQLYANTANTYWSLINLYLQTCPLEPVIVEARLQANRKNGFQSPIYFDQILINKGYGMKRFLKGGTQGTLFKAPRSGHYRFSISGNSGPPPTEKGGRTVISIRQMRLKSKVEESTVMDASHQAENNMHFTRIFYLKTGDRLELGVTESQMMSSCLMPITFTGQLLERKVHLTDMFHEM